MSLNQSPILTLKSELLYNRRPNSLESDYESLTIQFGSPNHLSILSTAYHPFADKKKFNEKNQI